MSQVMDYKCPCCGGDIQFDSNAQKMKCPYCDSEFEMESVKAYDDVLKNEKADDINWDTAGQEWEEDEDISVFVCNSCGGEIVGDKNTAATACPYCDSSVVIKGRVAGTLRPDYVIPFKLDKETAKKALTNHFKGKILLPKVFKSENHIDEIKGIYVPFWLFETDTDASIRYRGVKVRTWRSGDYRYTEKSTYAAIREGSIGFDNVPVDGSSKMADDLMESLEPFDFSQAVDFQTAYLSGYFADKYDVTAEQSVERANARVKRSVEEAFRSTVNGYSSVTVDNTTVQFSNGKAKYALYPVWILNTTWRDKKYVFAMNGQTGKLVGDLPTDYGAFWKWFGIIGASASVITYLIAFIANML